ncbi:MAG: phosphoglycerate dehydrogenase [Gammaproteobacteria bacterium]
MTNRFRIQTLNNIAGVGLKRFPEQRYEVGADLETADAIMVRSHNMHDMDISPSVLAIGRAGAGVNNIPIDQLSERGVPVFNAPGANANAVKELVLAGMFLAARNLCPAWDYVRELEGSDEEMAKAVEAGKKRFVGFELPGRTLGVVGLGAIGVEVANAALGLGMNVIGYDPQITVRRAWQLSSGVEQAADIDDLFAQASMVTVHVPLIDATRHLINTERLKLMPKGCVVLNFARGGIVHDEAVVAALDDKHLAYYVTDFPNRFLTGREGVVALPHLGASTGEAEDNCAVMVADTLKHYLEDGNIRHSVNFPEALLRRARPYRITIVNENVPSMVGQISTALAEAEINIADLLNKSRGKLAYSILDLDAPVDADTVQRITAIDGILGVRVLPANDE